MVEFAHPTVVDSRIIFPYVGNPGTNLYDANPISILRPGPDPSRHAGRFIVRSN